MKKIILVLIGLSLMFGIASADSLFEDGFESDLSKYRVNMGRSQDEIADMSSRIEAELLDVLTPDERKAFELNESLQLLNETFKNFQ